MAGIEPIELAGCDSHKALFLFLFRGKQVGDEASSFTLL